jgi:hypothetical protein
MLVVETLIVCDKCGISFAGGDNKHLKGMQHRKLAGQEGWIYWMSTDTCPACRPRTKEGNVYKHSQNRKRRNSEK